MRCREVRGSSVVEPCPSGATLTLLVMIYQDQTLPLALRLEAANAAIPFEKPALAAISTTDEVDTGSDAALREVVARWYDQIQRRDN